MQMNTTSGKRYKLFSGMVGFVWTLFMSIPAWSSVDHKIFSELLGKYNRNGTVDYAGLKKEENHLDTYLDILSAIDPDSLPRKEKFAFYVNAYNAWTIKLILSGYPGLKSIKDLGSLFKSPWKKKFVNLGGKTITLDTIEHDILRPQFKDPRVHFAVNCASKGCPPLFAEPFTATKLDAQLDAATRRFVNDPGFNRIEGNTLYASSIFKWFGEDFDNDILGFFEKYANAEFKKTLAEHKPQLKIKYLKYDWSLNGL